LIAKILVPQLDGKSEDEINQEGRSYHWTYYSYEPVLNQHGQAYRLVWCLDDNEPGTMGIMKCYWRDKYNEGEVKFLRKEWKQRYKLGK
jgi:hypothetical protein